MALTRNSISEVRNYISRIKDLNQSIPEELVAINTSLLNDNNYQVFVSGTPIGQELNDKLRKIIEVEKNLSETIQDIIANCSRFVDIQEQLNGSEE